MKKHQQYNDLVNIFLVVVVALSVIGTLINLFLNLNK